MYILENFILFFYFFFEVMREEKRTGHIIKKSGHQEEWD